MTPREPDGTDGSSEPSSAVDPAGGTVALDAYRCPFCGAVEAEHQAVVCLGNLSRSNAALAAQKDGAYRERDQCVAGIAALAVMLGRPAWLGRHEGGDWDDDWRTIVFIDLPTGQVSWHIHDSELDLFGFLAWDGPPWDGHDTPEKYRRLYELSTPLCVKAAP